MKLSHVRVVVPLLAAVSLLTVACASPPEAEKKAANAAVSAATAAGADKYAPSEFSAMTAAVQKAESEMSRKAYKEAKASYETVKDLAEKAAQAAVAGKAAARAEAEKLIADLEGRWKVLQGQVEAAAKKLKADQKAVWDTDAKGVAEALEAAKAAVATDAAAAKATLASIPPVLDKWTADLAALAAPAKDAKKPAATK
jgi:LPS O-antigen subunit length determinant protein (WzzB/FepE family)